MRTETKIIALPQIGTCRHRSRVGRLGQAHLLPLWSYPYVHVGILVNDERPIWTKFTDSYKVAVYFRMIHDVLDTC